MLDFIAKLFVQSLAELQPVEQLAMAQHSQASYRVSTEPTTTTGDVANPSITSMAAASHKPYKTDFFLFFFSVPEGRSYLLTRS